VKGADFLKSRGRSIHQITSVHAPPGSRPRPEMGRGPYKRSSQAGVGYQHAEYFLMIPDVQYRGVFSQRDLAERHAAQIRAHFALEASIWNLPEPDITALAAAIQPERGPDDSWSVVWIHPRAPQGRAVLRVPAMGAADLVLRHAFAPRTNYARLWHAFQAVHDLARENGLTLLDETDMFGYDWLRCIETGYALGIVSAAGYPLQSSYILYLWAPRANVPHDVSSWSADRIAREGFTPARTSLRQLALDALCNVYTPVPATELRAHLEARHGRRTTPRELATVIAKEAFAFGKSLRREYIAPALDERGRPVRGWYTRSDWALGDRLVISGSTDDARRRAQTALAGELAPPWAAGVAAQIDVATQMLSAWSWRERTFGIKGTEA